LRMEINPLLCVLELFRNYCESGNGKA
jgi:hypothetical protein